MSFEFYVTEAVLCLTPRAVDRASGKSRVRRCNAVCAVVEDKIEHQHGYKMICNALHIFNILQLEI